MFAFVLGLLAALMTAFYSFRLIFMVFFGEPRADERTMAHIHESPQVMQMPLAVLMAGAIVSGFALYPIMVGSGAQDFWGEAIYVDPDRDVVAVLHSAHGEAANGHGEAAHHGEEHAATGAVAEHGGYHVPFLAHYASFILAVIGIAAAYLLFVKRPELPAQITAHFRSVYTFVYRKWMFDELYDFLFVRTAPRIGAFLWRRGDRGTIDAYGPDGVAKVAARTARGAGRVHTGVLYHYAFAMTIGVVVLATAIILAATV